MLKVGDRVVYHTQVLAPRFWHGKENCPQGYAVLEVKNDPGARMVLLETLSGVPYWIGEHAEQMFVKISTTKKRNLPEWF